MKPHPLFLTIVFVLVASLPSGSAAAQGQRPQQSVRPPQPPVEKIVPVPRVDAPSAGARGRVLSSAPASPVAAASAIQLGQPGTSFRYVRSFGVAEVPYFDDANHLNFPIGVAADGDNVWIGEQFGHRAVKYAADGAFVAQIGSAGSTTGSLWGVYDISVDGSGNTWVTSNGDVIKFDAAGSEVSRLWRDDDPNTHFSTAAGIAIDSAGNIYVSDGGAWWSRDEGNHRIQVFKPNGDYLATIGTTGVAGTGNLQFHGPHRIAIYEDVLYVADGGNERVQIINVSNPVAPVYVATLGRTGEGGNGSDHLSNPSGVAVDAARIYVADRYNNRVQVFDRLTRAYVTSVGGSQGPGNTQLYEPTDVAVDASGNLYVADFVNCRVQQFGADLQYKRTFGTTGVPYVTDDYHYNTPTGLAAAADGSLYITEGNGHRLIKLNASGMPQWTVGAAGVKGDWDYANDRLNNPGDVALDAAGRVYVADQWHGRVQIYLPNGAYYRTLDLDSTGIERIACPNGIAIAPNGFVYVADTCAQRVQIFNANLQYVTTLGVTGEAGSDDAHFDGPEDVAVDSRGTIYVSDQNNHRVQVFNSSRAHVRTIGETGVQGWAFGLLGAPNGLAVDGSNRLYVTDAWNNRVQVFDEAGAYLTTIGGSWGERTGQMRGAEGVAIGPQGEVYVADTGNHRVQQYALGTPGWRQANINGFGDPASGIVSALEPVGNRLYAGLINWSGSGAQLWRWDSSGWTPMNTNGFGDSHNMGIDDLIEFGGNLYASTWNAAAGTYETFGGQIWRSDNGQSWAPVVQDGFGDPTVNGEIYRLQVFKDMLYATTWSYTNAHGSEVWRSATGNSGDWTRVVENGFGDALNVAVMSTAVYGGWLYMSTENWDTSTNPPTPSGGEVWRSDDGQKWEQVSLDGFGDMFNSNISSLAPFGNSLYAATMYSDGVHGNQVWRCQVCDGSDWVKVADNGFGNPKNRSYHALMASGGNLYSVTANAATGLEVWRTADGAHWGEVQAGGFGDSNNQGPFWGNSLATFGDRLWVGTVNNANGGEIWAQTKPTYLPAVVKK